MRGPHVRLGATYSTLFTPYKSLYNSTMIMLKIPISDDCVLLNTENWPIIKITYRN